MARESMVTRTIITTNATVMCINVETAEPYNETVKLPGTHKDNNAILKQAKKLLENDTVKCVHVVDVAEEQKLYGMKEVDFIAHAEILPSRSKDEN